MAGSPRETTISIRKFIIFHHISGKSVRNIAKLVNLSHSTVQYVIKCFKEENRIENKYGEEKNEELNPKNLIGTVKYGGGGVPVWGCMSASELGNLVFIDGMMNHDLYLNILRDNLKLSAENLGIGNNFVFHQDNDPEHTALNVRLWCLTKFKTPPQSPDLNPIEHIWRELEVRVRKHDIKTKSELKTVMMEEWMNIDAEITKKKEKKM
ncbi:Transposable element Tc1 transposase [Araneus ventricosus]|uniref:Transposable element Tc1 transposase n=1 Tax=Araneus ventricosus TaxID=182803 RepID=A0A4Y2JHJ3_ARAVE|nr:Transposable element Tc1 transposase [Araneus ventricosus]